MRTHTKKKNMTHTLSNVESNNKYPEQLIIIVPFIPHPHIYCIYMLDLIHTTVLISLDYKL